jgi:hypothetical protein
VSCKNCNAKLNITNKTGYCTKCWRSNVDNVKSKNYWKIAGAVLTESEIQRHNDTDKCDLCSKNFTNDKVLDHCHDTGKYRGTLCRQCNTSLGKLGDDLDLIIKKIKEYKKGR